LSILFNRTFSSIQDLNRYRKEVTAKLSPDASELAASLTVA